MSGSCLLCLAFPVETRPRWLRLAGPFFVSALCLQRQIAVDLGAELSDSSITADLPDTAHAILHAVEGLIALGERHFGATPNLAFVFPLFRVRIDLSAGEDGELHAGLGRRQGRHGFSPSGPVLAGEVRFDQRQ